MLVFYNSGIGASGTVMYDSVSRPAAVHRLVSPIQQVLEDSVVLVASPVDWPGPGGSQLSYIWYILNES
jgi:hypothetical protein